ncbi:Rossmann-like domain-containing protein [Parasphingorhabdus pacifica]
MPSTPPPADLRVGDNQLDQLIEAARADGNPADTTASVAFLTVQAAQHSGRRTSYLNTVLSVRIGAAVGSCAVEPGQISDDVVTDTVGRDIDELLSHPERAVRMAALDAYLAHLRPHAQHPAARTVRIAPGTSLEKSMARARAVAQLVPGGGRVAVIGVVNSLLSALRERGIDYVPCDLKGGRTEWDEPVLEDHRQAIEQADAVLASGMVLNNTSFDDIVEQCRELRLPLVMFAQTGSAVLRELLGTDITALSAEPYPFFWLTGDATDLHCYRGDRP